MRALVSAAVSGVLFAVGLALAGMTQPKKVIAFLDFAGDWDPSLLLVMVGAIAVYLPAQRLIYRRRAPLLDARFHLPRETELTSRLFVGAGLFGIGWGIAGYCPGPALSSLFSGSSSAIIFVASMVMGIALARAYEGRSASVPTIGGAVQAQ
ncbi:MAG: YeeE/YedE family protein [Deltaproteobacteria bacterium]|nr:MAG: YeeE/YedE family protein [Deltaproteobacteria bacterium]